MAAPILNEKWHVLLDEWNYWVVQNATGYHQGLELPSSTNGAALMNLRCSIGFCHTHVAISLCFLIAVKISELNRLGGWVMLNNNFKCFC